MEKANLEDNNLKWSSIDLLIHYLLNPNSIKQQNYGDLYKKVFETPVALSQKYDGTNVGRDEDGMMYGRNKLISESTKSYQKTDLQCVKNVDVAPIKKAFADSIGVDETKLAKFVLYGELMCNSLYDYKKEGLDKTYQVFGAMVKVEEDQVDEVYSKIHAAGYSVNMDEENHNMQIGFNARFFELVSKTFNVKTVPLVGQYKSIYEAVKANQEWMLKGMGEGLIVTTDKTIHKWKIGAEMNSSNIGLLDTVLDMLKDDAGFLAPNHAEATELFKIMRAIQVSTAMVKAANPDDEYQAAVKSAMTKFDAPDKFEYNQYVELIRKECLSDIQIDDTKQAKTLHLKMVEKHLEKLGVKKPKVIPPHILEQMKKKKELEIAQKEAEEQKDTLEDAQNEDLSKTNVKIKQVAAFALLVLGGKEKPTAADVKKLLKEAGVKAETDEIEKMIAAFGDQPFHELVAGGLEKMATMGSSGPAAAGGAAVGSAAPIDEEKKEEEVDVGPGNLFGDDEDDY